MADGDIEISSDGAFKCKNSLISGVLILDNIEGLSSLMSGFYNCKHLKEIDLSKVNTSNVTSMMQMFSGCNNLASLDLSNFNTIKVELIDGMFQGCSSLEHLDISGFDFSNISQGKTSAFEGVPTNCEVLVKDEIAINWIATNAPQMTNVKIK